MIEATSLREAISLLDPEDPTIRPVAGGTALMLMMKSGVFTPTRLVSLQRIEPRYSEISLTPKGEVRIGAMATLADLERDRTIAEHLPTLKRALRRLSNPRVRNVARVGGALAHGDPHMDLPPVMAAYGARVTVAGPKGERELPVDTLYAGYYETVLDKNELITAVTVPAQTGRRSTYLKITSRVAEDWPTLGIALSFAVAGGAAQAPIVVVSAATEKMARLAAAEALLAGAKPEEAVLRRASDAAADEASILADAHGSAPYKRELLRVYLKRAVAQAFDGAEVRS